MNYILYGEEHFLIRKEIDKIVDKNVTFEKNMNTVFFDATKVSMEDIIADAQTLPFFSEVKVVVISNANFLTSSDDTKCNLEVLEKYMEEREMIDAYPGHEDAFFLSMQRKRMSVRTVENLVKKYSRLVTPLKKITPHKLRSTYGTSLYRETGDIYLVASVLGHNDVNTTRKHYAAQEDERRRSARNVVKLRED